MSSSCILLKYGHMAIEHTRLSIESPQTELQGAGLHPCPWDWLWKEDMTDLPCTYATKLEGLVAMQETWIQGCYNAFNMLKGWARTEKSIFPLLVFTFFHNNIMAAINIIILKITYKCLQSHHSKPLNYIMSTWKSIFIFYRIVENFWQEYIH